MLKLKAYIICLHNEYLKLRAETKNVLALFYTRKGGGIYVELDYIFSAMPVDKEFLCRGRCEAGRY